MVKPAGPASDRGRGSGELVALRTVQLPPEPASPSAARRLLREVLTAVGREDCLDAAELACTELVTNAVLHAHTEVELTIEIRTDVRIRVHDRSPALPSQRDYDTEATTGRGLALVAAISDDYGIVDAGLAGKTVWFSVGGDRPERTDEEILAAFDLGDWDIEALVAAEGKGATASRDAIARPGASDPGGADGVEAGRGPAAGAPSSTSVGQAATVPPPSRTVRLLGLPGTLWLAARQHHDALLRDLVLYLAVHDRAGVDIVGTDRARALVSSAVMPLVREAQAADDVADHLPPGHPSPLPRVPRSLDIELTVPVALGYAFGAMQDTLDAAEELARDGRLFVRPGLPEIIAMRDWMCSQVVAQLAGVEASPWGGSDQERFIGGPEQTDDPLADFDVGLVREADRGIVAADDANRIIAVSRPLAELMGWEVDDLVGRRVVAIIPPALREAHVAGFTRHLTTGEAHVLGVPITLPVLRADGSEILCHFLLDRVPSGAGRSVYLAWIDPVEGLLEVPPSGGVETGEGTDARVGTASPTASQDRGPGAVQADRGVVAPAPTSGQRASPGPRPGEEAGDAAPLAVDHLTLFRVLPTPYMVMSPDLVIVDANDAYLANVGRTREDIVGRPVFESFPPTPDALDPDGVSRVQRSFELARDTGVPHTMPIQKYDIADPVNGGMSERFWSLVSIPVLDGAGRTVLIAQRSEDITDFVRERESRYEDRQRSETWRRRVEEVEVDLFARAQELAAALHQHDVTAQRLASLASAAAMLTSAETVEDLERIAIARGVPVLGADIGAVTSRHPDGGWRVAFSDLVPDDVREQFAQVPYDSRFPGSWVARTGERLLLPTRRAGAEFWEGMPDLYARTGRAGAAILPLRVQERVIGSLAVSWSEDHEVTSDEMVLLDALAAQLAQAFDRVHMVQAQRAGAADAQRLSETLQRSMLTQPPPSGALSIAVRYQPAAEQAQVGGDWYDAFGTAEGTTMLVVGDVAGHDRVAAAMMGQLRNLLRGMAYDSHDGPAALLQRLDAAIRGLELDTMATAVLARIDPCAEGGDPAVAGTRLLRWSNAGHPPPVLRSPDGTVRLLEHRSDLLLGVDPGVVRSEGFVDVAPGSTLVLYTDGLVERRDASLSDGIARLVEIVRSGGDLGVEELADSVLGRLGSESREDDIAMLVLRVADS